MRVAAIVPKHGRTIVQRNRLKRRLREAFRLALLPPCRDRGTELDVLVRARPEAYDLSFGDLRQEIESLARELCSHASSSH